MRYSDSLSHWHKYVKRVRGRDGNWRYYYKEDLTPKEHLNRAVTGAANDIKKNVRSKYGNAQRAVRNEVDKAGKTINKGIRDTKRNIHNTEMRVGKKANDVQRTINKGIRDTKRNVNRTVRNTQKTINKGVRDTKRNVNKTVNRVGKTINNTYKNVIKNSRSAISKGKKEVSSWFDKTSSKTKGNTVYTTTKKGKIHRAFDKAVKDGKKWFKKHFG